MIPPLPALKIRHVNKGSVQYSWKFRYQCNFRDKMECLFNILILKLFDFCIHQHVDIWSSSSCIQDEGVEYHRLVWGPILEEQEAAVICEGKDTSRNGKLEASWSIITSVPSLRKFVKMWHVITKENSPKRGARAVGEVDVHQHLTPSIGNKHSINENEMKAIS